MSHVLQDSFCGTLRASETDINPVYGLSNYLGQIVPMVSESLGGGEFIYVLSPAADITGQTISSITAALSGGVITATVTTGSAHGLSAGAKVLFVGQAPTGYAGEFEIATVPSTTTFTMVVARNALSNLANATTVGTYTAAPITVGDVIEFEYTLASGVTTTRVKKWAGDANTGKNLGVAYASCFASRYFWVQIAGYVPVQVTDTPAIGNPAFFSAAGKLKADAVAGKQVIGAEFVTTIGALYKILAGNRTTPTLTINTQLLPTTALVNINRPKVQTQDAVV